MLLVHEASVRGWQPSIRNRKAVQEIRNCPGSMPSEKRGEAAANVREEECFSSELLFAEAYVTRVLAEELEELRRDRTEERVLLPA